MRRRETPGWKLASAVALFSLMLAGCGSGSGDTAGEGTGTPGAEDNGQETPGRETTSGESEPASGDEAELIEARFAYYPVPIFLSAFIAREQGIYEEHGLDVELVAPADPPTQLRLLMTGDLDGSIFAISGLQTIAAEGQDVRIVGSVMNRGAFLLTVAGDWADLEAEWDAKLRALEGRTIGVPGLGGGADTTIRALLTAAGMDPDNDLTIVSITDPAAAQNQLESETIDGYVYAQPWPLRYEAAGAGDIYLDLGSDVPTEYGTVATGSMGMSNAMLADNEELARRWIAAEEAAIDYITNPANRDAVVQAMADEMVNGDVEMSEELLDYVLAIYEENLEGLAIPRPAFENQMHLLEQAGNIEEDSISYDDMVTKWAKE